jgi:hypothetical protein
MNKSNNYKREYIAPTVELIQLDNEISLALASDPPTYETNNKLAPEYFNNDPFKSHLC